MTAESRAYDIGGGRRLQLIDDAAGGSRSKHPVDILDPRFLGPGVIQPVDDRLWIEGIVCCVRCEGQGRELAFLPDTKLN